MIVAIDFGITNTDVALSNKSQYKFFSIPSKNANENKRTIKPINAKTSFNFLFSLLFI